MHCCVRSSKASCKHLPACEVPPQKDSLESSYEDLVQHAKFNEDERALALSVIALGTELYGALVLGEMPAKSGLLSLTTDMTKI